MKKHLIITVAFLGWSLPILSQQTGSIDLTFNPFDLEMYYRQTGFNAEVYDIAEVAPNAYVAVGDFSEVNGQPCNQIAKINGTLGFLDVFPQHTFTGTIRYIEKQSTGKLIIAGTFSEFDGISTRVIRLNADGTLDNTFTTPSFFTGTITDLRVGSNDEIYVTGYQMYFDATPHNGIFRLLPDGGVDPSFNTMGGSNDFVNGVRFASDGGLFLFGNFTYFGVTSVGGYVKLLPTGQVDNTFNANNLTNVKFVEPVSNGYVYAAEDYNNISRLFDDGSIDNSFSTPPTSGSVRVMVPKANDGLIVCTQLGHFVAIEESGAINSALGFSVDEIRNVLKLDSGRYAVCGLFPSINGVNYVENFAVIDSTSIPLPNPLPFASSAYSYKGKVSMHGSDRIAATGSGTIYGTDSYGFALYKLDGSIDTAFMDNFGTGYLQHVKAIKSLDNGQLLLGGDYYAIRVNADGSYDPTFVTPSLNGAINSIDVQLDGKILIAGSFTQVGGSLQYYIARLNADGSNDPTFQSSLFDNATFGKRAEIVKTGANGKIYVGGNFACCAGILRLNSNGSIDNSFYTGSYTAPVVYDIEEMSTGHVLFCGELSPTLSNHRPFWYRSKPNGQYDATFNAFSVTTAGYGKTAYDIEPYGDAAYVISGDLEQHGMYRIIDTIGTVLASSEDVISTNGIIYNTTVQTDGKIVAVGTWSYLNNMARNYIARIEHFTNLKDTLCPEEPLVFGSIFDPTPTSGFYYDTIVSSMQSDSIVLLDLYVVNLPTNAYVYPSHISLGICPSCIIQWFDCNTGLDIQGANSETYTPSSSGYYGAYVESGGCYDTIQCTAFNLVAGMIEQESLSYLVFPNPTTRDITIQLNENQEATRYLIYDLVGRIVQNGIITSKEIKIALDEAQGTYFLELFNTEKSLGRTCILKQ